MAVYDIFAGEIATELFKMLISITRKACLCKPSAEQLLVSIQELLPIIEEIKYSGVELTATRQMQLNFLSRALHDGHELAGKVLASSRWNVNKNLQLSRKMEKVEKKISSFLRVHIQAHILADVHHARFESTERFDRLEGSNRRLEQRLGSMKIGGSGGGWWIEEAVEKIGVEEPYEGNLVKVGMELGKTKVKEMILNRDDLVVIGINGIGGSGKTTLAMEICRDDEVRSYYNNKILFLKVSQSPNVENLRQRIFEFISESKINGCSDIASQWPIQYNPWNSVTPILLVLDDVWSLPVLSQLIVRVPGCKILVVSRSNFQTELLNATYELELLREEDAISLFCHTAFGKTSIPPGSDENLIKQIVEKCKGLPLALKVIGASLRDQPETYWIGAKNRLSRAQPICDSHQTELLNRMKLSIDYLSDKVRDCFLDLGSFDVLENIWTELHDIDVLKNIWTELHDIDEDCNEGKGDSDEVDLGEDDEPLFPASSSSKRKKSNNVAPTRSTKGKSSGSSQWEDKLDDVIEALSARSTQSFPPKNCSPTTQECMDIVTCFPGFEEGSRMYCRALRIFLQKHVRENFMVPKSHAARMEFLKLLMEE